jgi:hypothetical protein
VLRDILSKILVVAIVTTVSHAALSYTAITDIIMITDSIITTGWNYLILVFPLLIL